MSIPAPFDPLEAERRSGLVKRRFYVAALTVTAFVAIAHGVDAQVRGDVESTQVVLYLYAAVVLPLAYALQRDGRLLGFAERAAFALGTGVLLAPLGMRLLGSDDPAIHELAMTSFAAWAPLIYVWGYLVFGSRRGLAASGLFFTGSALVVTAYALRARVTGAPPTELGAMIEFTAASLCYATFLHAFAHLLERQSRDRAKAELVARYAYRDLLTGLPNRLLLRDRLEHAIAATQRTGVPFAVLFLDLDGFKGVNDTHGHHAGDELLRQVARRLEDAVRRSDTVARISGDEFVVLAVGPGDDGTLHEVATKLLGVFEAPFAIEGRAIEVTGSVGVARHPGHGATVDDLLNHADAAMYRAKQAGRNRYRLVPGADGEQAAGRWREPVA